MRATFAEDDGMRVWEDQIQKKVRRWKEAVLEA